MNKSAPAVVEHELALSDAVTPSCANCDHVARPNDSKNPRTWLCDLFKRDEYDPVTREKEPPYWRCDWVLRYTCRNRESPCEWFEATKRAIDETKEER